jgi:hypothetical protein
MNKELQFVCSTSNVVEVKQIKIELDIHMILTQLGINQDRWPREFKGTSNALLEQKQ